MAEPRTCAICHKILKPRERHGLYENMCLVCSRNQQVGKRDQHREKTRRKKASAASPRRQKTVADKTNLAVLNVAQLQEQFDKSRNSIDHLKRIADELDRRRTKIAGNLLRKVKSRLVDLGTQEVRGSKRPSRAANSRKPTVSKARKSSKRNVVAERKLTKFQKSKIPIGQDRVKDVVKPPSVSKGKETPVNELDDSAVNIASLEKELNETKHDISALNDLLDRVDQIPGNRAKALSRKIKATLLDRHAESNVEVESSEIEKSEHLGPEDPRALNASLRIDALITRLLQQGNSRSLMNLNHNPNSRSHIQLIDCDIYSAWATLKSTERIEIYPLQELEEEDKEENFPEFLEKLAEQRYLNEEYLLLLEEYGDEDIPDHIAEVEERKLRDIVRSELGMGERIEADHNNPAYKEMVARSQDIDPSYLLKLQDPNGTKSIDKLQTLQFVDQLNAKLQALARSYRTAIEETGVNALHLCFGFLEWFDSKQSNKKRLSPILMVPVDIERFSKDNQIRFGIENDGEEALLNPVLKSELNKLGIDLPDFFYEDDDILDFLAQVEEQAKHRNGWAIKNFITLGIFQSTSAIMADGLNPNNWPEGRKPFTHPVVAKLLGESSGDSLLSSESYDVDSQEIEQMLGPTVLSTDESQFSAIVDVIKGKDLVISGPPGTGKSQTIANLISALIGKGKSVLFVAEKMAALDVVKKRLDDVGLGPFILELHSTKSHRRRILDGLGARIKVNKEKGSNVNLAGQVDLMKMERNKLLSYARRLRQKVAQTEKTLFEIMGTCVKLESDLLSDSESTPIGRIPSKIYTQKWPITHSRALTPEKERQISEELARYSQLRKEILSTWKSGENHPWSWVTRRVEPTDVQILRALVSQIDVTIEELKGYVNKYGELGLLENPDITVNELVSQNERVLAALGHLGSNVNQPLLKRICTDISSAKLDEYRSTYAQKVERETRINSSILLKDPKNSLDLLRQIEQYLMAKKLGGISEICEARKNFDDRNSSVNEVINFIDECRKIKDFKHDFSPRTANLLMAVCREIVATPHTSVERVNSVMGWSNATEVLEKGKSIALEIADIKKRCSNQISLDHKESIPSLMAASRSLRSAGFFGRLKKSVRLAEQKWETLSVRPLNPSRSVMVKDLQDAVKYAHKINTLHNIENLKEIVGTGFKGEQTDFDSYLEAHDLWKRIASMGAQTQLGTFSDVIKALVSVDFYQHQTFKELVEHEVISKNLEALAKEDETLLVHMVSQIQKNMDETDQILGLVSEASLNDTLTSGELSELYVDIETYSSCLTKLNELAPIGEMLDELRVDPIKEKNQIDKTCSVFNIFSEIVPNHERSKIWENLSEDADETISNLKDISIGLKDILSEFNSLLENLSGLLIDPKLEPQLESLARIFRASVENSTSLEEWNSYISTEEAVQHPTTNLLVDIFNRSPQIDLPKVWLYLNYFNLIRDFFKKYPELNMFDGATMESARKRFKELDEKLQRLAGIDISNRLRNVSPPRGNGKGRVSSYTEMSLLNHQLGLRRPSKSIRSLMDTASSSLAALKPCFMMSPASVAQFLVPGKYNFDVVVIDEASQMRTEEAIGALARGKQIAIVGDSEQLPPTSFFRRNQDLDDDDIEETEESILDLAKGRLKDKRDLRWHYRSRHESLIQFSNERFYGGDLITFPSANQLTEFGVHSHYVKNGIYSGGKQTKQSGINVEEARWVIDAALSAIEENPDRSLGIVTMNVKQADYMSELWDKATEENPIVREYERRWRETISPFFIKNLENVQGDERDHVIISTVYGRNELGAPVYQRFGPVNQANGHRRLNVLFTRARERIDLFTSMNSGDINAPPGSSEGVNTLKSYLAYARTGQLETGVTTDGLPDSDFEVAVANRLRARGFKVTHQVGVSGFKVDLGVEHEDYPHGFIAGIECDGKTYHSSRSARDSDILRQELLEAQGWRIYRVWSTDWFRDQDNEIDRLVKWLSSQVKNSVKDNERSRTPIKVSDTLVPTQKKSDKSKEKEIKLGEPPADEPLPDGTIDDYEGLFNRESLKVWGNLSEWMKNNNRNSRNEKNLLVEIKSSLRDYNTVSVKLRHDSINFLRKMARLGWKIQP